MFPVIEFLQKMINLKLSGNRRHLPLPQGPHNVGCMDIMTEYSSNGCLIRLYYPSATQDDQSADRTMQWPLWIPAKEYLNGYARFLGMWTFIFRLLYRLIVGNMYIPASWKAIPTQGQAFPLVIFSHGMGGCRTSYSTICAEIASHGFVVAAVEHRDRTACLTYYLRALGTNTDTTSFDKTVSKEGAISSVTEWIHYKRVTTPQKEYPIRNQQVFQRSHECIKALDLLLDMNRGVHINNLEDTNVNSSMFQGIIDVSRIAIVGHSFGGVTIVPTMSSDKRFKAGVALDAWMFSVREEEGIFASVSQPLLFVNMEKFQTPNNKSVMQRLASSSVDRRMTTIRGTIHQNPADTPFMAGRLMKLFFGASSSLDSHLAMDLIKRLTLQFLWKHLDIHSNEKYTSLLNLHSDILEETVLC